MSEVKEETTVTELNEVLEEIVAPQEQEIERVVFWVDETHVKIKEVHYEIVEDYREGFELDAFNARYQDIFDKSYEMYAIFDEETGTASLYTYEPTLRLRKDKIDRDVERAINNLHTPIVCSAVQHNEWIDWESKNQYGSTGQIDFFIDVDVKGETKHIRIAEISYYPNKNSKSKQSVYLNYLPKSRKDKSKRTIDDSIAEMLDADLSDVMLELKRNMIQKMVEGRYKRLLVELKEKLGWDVAGMIDGTVPLPCVDRLSIVPSPMGEGVYLQADVTPVEE